MTTIRYFLPEDGDSEITPNVFIAPKPNRPGYPPCLGQIKHSFPLPGTYHFRFKTALVPGTDKDKNAVSVWMDCVEDSEPVPVWQNSIVARVTRIGVPDDEEEDYDEDIAGRDVTRAESNLSSGYSVGSTASAQSLNPPKPTITAPPLAAPSSDSLLGAFDDPPPTPAAPSDPLSTHSSTENLLDVAHPPAPPAGTSLLDMDTPAAGYSNSGTTAPAQSDHDELLNMTAPMPTHHHPPPPQGSISAPTQYTAQGRGQPQPPPGRPQQPAMQGQYPMQYSPHGQFMPQQGQFSSQQGLQPVSGQPPRGQPSQPPRQASLGPSGSKNAFDKFSSSTLDPLGNLSWG